MSTSRCRRLACLPERGCCCRHSCLACRRALVEEVRARYELVTESADLACVRAKLPQV